MKQLRVVREQFGQLTNINVLAHFPLDGNSQVDVYSPVLFLARVERTSWQVFDARGSKVQVVVRVTNPLFEECAQDLAFFSQVGHHQRVSLKVAPQ